MLKITFRCKKQEFTRTVIKSRKMLPTYKKIHWSNKKWYKCNIKLLTIATVALNILLLCFRCIGRASCGCCELPMYWSNVINGLAGGESDLRVLRFCNKCWNLGVQNYVSVSKCQNVVRGFLAWLKCIIDKKIKKYQEILVRQFTRLKVLEHCFVLLDVFSTQMLSSEITMSEC